MANKEIIDLSTDEAERHAAQQHEMYLQDQLAINNEKFEQGIEKGREERNIEIAKNAKNMGLDIDNIAELTGLSVDEIEKL